MAAMEAGPLPEPDGTPANGVQLQLWGASERIIGLLRHAPAFRGQLAGVVLIMLPALVHPIGLGVLHGPVQLVAALAGAAGAVLLFGGLAIRLLDPRVVAARARGKSVDDALRALPHAREIWTALALLSLGLAAGALACLARAVGGDVTDRLSEALLLGLPAAVLGWVVWRSRALRLSRR